MADYPPIDRSYVVSYAASDRDYPVIGIKRDPRTAGYKVPEDLSPHPDSKRYPNHVFTGAQPASGDQIVTHVYEILPAPWVPFTRYDDDLGPIQGRRRAVKNEGQQADLASDRKISYEGRDGSAIVSLEIEETWSIKTDEDGNSLFPIKDRDFYDPSRGPVKERRQLIVPTGEETASLENENGVITQISYEPYNEFLSYKVVQTYSVAGPQLVSKVTNNEGQLATITAQRKAANGYVPPELTALLTVEANAEDKESLVERKVEIPAVFAGKTRSLETIDITPEKFRVFSGLRSEEILEAGIVPDNITFDVVDGQYQLSKSEQQVTEFVKRIRKTYRGLQSNSSLEGKVYTSELGGGLATVTEEFPSSDIFGIPEYGTVSDELTNVGGNYKLRRKVKLQPINQQFPEEADEDGNIPSENLMPILRGQDYDEELDIVIPYKRVFASATSSRFTEGNRKRVTPRDVVYSEVIRYDVEDAQQSLDEYYWEIPDMIEVALPDKLMSISAAANGVQAQSEAPTVNGDTYSYTQMKRNSVGATLRYDIEEGFRGVVPTIRAVFFLPKGAASPNQVLQKVRNEKENQSIQFWPNVRPRAYQIAIVETSQSEETSESVSFDSAATSTSTMGSVTTNIANVPATIHGDLDIDITGFPSEAGTVSITPSSLSATEYSTFPTGLFVYRINASPYRFSYVRIDALLVDITNDYV
jgi:hypothetical protein